MSTELVHKASRVSQSSTQNTSQINQTPIEFAPHHFCGITIPSQTNQTLYKKPIKCAPHHFFGITNFQTPERTPLKFAPHQYFSEITNPKSLETPIPDLFQGIPEFNIIRRHLMYNHRYREDDPHRIRPEFQPHSEYNAALVGPVFSAIEFLKEEKMIPTKENIHNFLRHSDRPNHRQINVEEALDHAIEHNDILMQELGEQRLYFGRYSYLWPCVNPAGGRTDRYSDATWDQVEKFLRSLDGRVKVLLSKSRYEVALALKNSCLRRVCMGRVMQILNMVIAKGWIEIYEGGPCPISVTLPRS